MCPIIIIKDSFLLIDIINSENARKLYIHAENLVYMRLFNVALIKNNEIVPYILRCWSKDGHATQFCVKNCFSENNEMKSAFVTKARNKSERSGRIELFTCHAISCPTWWTASTAGREEFSVAGRLAAPETDGAKPIAGVDVGVRPFIGHLSTRRRNKSDLYALDFNYADALPVQRTSRICVCGVVMMMYGGGLKLFPRSTRDMSKL